MLSFSPSDVIPETSQSISNSRRLQERLREDRRLQDLADITAQHLEQLRMYSSSLKPSQQQVEQQNTGKTEMFYPDVLY